MQKRTKLTSLIFLFLYFFFTNNANAEFYNYTDEKGVVHYTDDYSTIPEKFRNESIANDEIISDYTDEIKKPEMEIEATASNADNGERKKLLNKISAHEQEYGLILKAQDELNNFRQLINTKKEAEEYRGRAEMLKNRQRLYNENERKLFREVEAYNLKNQKNLEKRDKAKPVN